MKTELINNSNSTTKTAEYIALFTSLINDCQETAHETSNPLVENILNEMLIAKNNPITCEYEAYIVCNTIENWHNQIDECFA
jgi:hypothetical protein